MAEAVVSDAIAAHDKVFGVLDQPSRKPWRALARVVEQGTGHELLDDHIVRRRSIKCLISLTST